ncbi:hypothetical protein GCM10023169_08750 [Georgenia halophila]|uniref:Septum formation-related domain-containing protein n=1 Tax=Georgenia halophila TaxID=620889 RepID=A0ABP8KYC6_9MICO
MRAAALPSVVATALLVVPLAACGSGNVMSLEPGDCLDQSDLEGAQVTDVEILECSEEHDAEVFAEVTHSGEEFPGNDAVKQEAEAECTTSFEEFVGVPYAESELTFSTLSPSQESWESADDRTSLCILTVDQPMNGSLEGANR